MVGPNLTDEFWIHGGDVTAIMKSIKTGYPDKGMMPYGTNARLSDRQVLQLASYILSKQGSNPPNPKAIDPAREVKFVPEAEKAAAETEKPKETKAASVAEKKAEPAKREAAKK
jgi:cytochrome c oxidase cbb3-type subunit 3